MKHHKTLALTALLALGITAALPAHTTYANTPVTIMWDNPVLQYRGIPSISVSPLNEGARLVNGRTFVPIRAYEGGIDATYVGPSSVHYAFRADQSWVTVTHRDIDDNGLPTAHTTHRELIATPFMDGPYLFVALRDLRHFAEIHWDGETRTATYVMGMS